MEEQILIKAEFKKNIIAFCLLALGVFISIIALIAIGVEYSNGEFYKSYGYGYGLWYPYDLEYSYSEFLGLALSFEVAIGASILLYLSLVCYIVSIILFCQMSRCELTITNQRVMGKAGFGKKVDLPLMQISEMGFGLFSQIYFVTSSGKVHFWLVENREQIQKNILDEVAKDETRTSPIKVNNDDMYCELSTHILLLIFTFGIWNYIWIYRITKYLNRVKGEEERNPRNQLLLCMFIPFYSIYWTYKSAQRIDKHAKKNNISSDLSTICLVLAIFIGIVPPILMQDKINEIVGCKTQIGQEDAITAERINSPSQETKYFAAEEIKKYKELLDMGIITQEEFETKKKELLGL